MVGKRIVGYLFFACFSLAESKDDTVTVKESPTQPAVVPTQKYNFGCKTRLILVPSRGRTGNRLLRREKHRTQNQHIQQRQS